MGKPSWVTISKSLGSGNDTFTISANEHTGREVRSGTVTIQGTGVSGSKTISVSQAAKAEFIDISNTIESIGKDGGNVTVYGKTNAKAFSIGWVVVDGTTNEYSYDNVSPLEKSDTGINYPEISLPTSITIDGDTITASASTPADTTKDYFVAVKDSNSIVHTLKGALNATDPGARNAYDFSFVLTFPKNETVETVMRTMLATTDGGQTSQITFKQTAETAWLTASPDIINLNNAGTAQTVTVKSNTTWTVS